jgi:hypothetical protein
MKSAFFALAVLGLSASPAAAAYVYTPSAALETQDGNINNVVFKSGADNHVQWAFDPAIFGPDPLEIEGVAFRFDKAVANSPNSGTFNLGAGFKVQLATRSTSLSATFADNLAGATTVVSGPLKLPFTIGAPAGSIKPFGVHFVFDRPYLYDPGKGSLLFDMFVPDPGVFATFDFVRNDPLEERLFNSDGHAATGQVQLSGPVARFDVSPAPVPEPAAWALMIAGLGGAGGALRRRRLQLRTA